MNTKQTVITAKREMVVGHDAAAHLGRQRIKKLCTTGDRRTGLAQMQYVKAAIKQPTDKKASPGMNSGEVITMNFIRFRFIIAHYTNITCRSL